MKVPAFPLILSATLSGLALLPLPFAAVAKEPPAAAQSNQAPQFMFVQTADRLQDDGQTLRLVNVAPQNLFFSDRPKRIAGHLSMADYLKEWTAAAGPNNFAADPPNATISVFDKAAKVNTLAVVEISKPKLDGRDLVYRYRLIEGEMPRGGGATALFIDWIGVGGGVGPGFHGVGVGYRGVGWR